MAAPAASGGVPPPGKSASMGRRLRHERTCLPHAAVAAPHCAPPARVRQTATATTTASSQPRQRLPGAYRRVNADLRWTGRGLRPAADLPLLVQQMAAPAAGSVRVLESGPVLRELSLQGSRRRIGYRACRPLREPRLRQLRHRSTRRPPAARTRHRTVHDRLRRHQRCNARAREKDRTGSGRRRTHRAGRGRLQQLASDKEL